MGLNKPYNRALLVGDWFSTATNEQGDSLSEFAHLSADGSFEFRFVRQNKAGELIEEAIEYGDWGLVGNVHFTITKSEFIENEHFAADLNDENNYHAYHVTRLDSHVFVYQHVETQEEYVLRRLSPSVGMC
ncbi:hypothetical protein LP316_15690 [Thalassotalea sp. LPB0316]|uniref:hypothetical protein n=1 Tax=Thalassotalea sp. LPB0316 TaxID=2769490 RepID=UPI0018670A8F|nr:hypothetical protein [Thalassotalea sp. LPB0316]QOL25708.1 hypothetical protein LP316_15690 [Thalassotalea sp. LPB0316]